MENNNRAMSFTDFISKCRLLDEACRQWCCFIDEAPERRSGYLFTEFYHEICEQKYQEYLNEHDYHNDCNYYATLPNEEKYSMALRSAMNDKEDTTVSYDRSKPASQPQSAEKLAEELNKCVELQDTMKEVNAYWRKTGTCAGAPGITDTQATKLDDKIATSKYTWERQQPFSTYDLTNNNSKIKHLEQKVSEASRGFSGWEFNGGRAEANTDMNRLQLFFDERPDEKQRAVLKANGFKWAPSQEAWQRQLTDNAIYAATYISFIKPSDGRTVREHQPKPPAKDTGAR